MKYFYIVNNSKENKIVQEKLFKEGYKWNNEEDGVVWEGFGNYPVVLTFHSESMKIFYSGFLSINKLAEAQYFERKIEQQLEFEF